MADDYTLCALEHLLGLTVQHPMVGVCVVKVDGELDTLSASRLDARIQERLAAAPTHLILDLQPVRFLGSTGLTSLLCARELAQTTGT
jgi:anti-sigma B factor antagonist